MCGADEFECAVTWLDGDLMCADEWWVCDEVRDCSNVNDEADCDDRRSLEAKKSKNVVIMWL